MTIKPTKFTPEVLLAAPRRSAGIPNPAGTHLLFTESTYSFEAHKKTNLLKVLDVATGDSSIIYDNDKFSEPAWVGNEHFVFVKGAEKGASSLMLGHAFKAGTDPVEIKFFDAAISNIRIKQKSDTLFAFACSALADPAGRLHNPETVPKPHTSARIYSSLYVRHWDTWKDDSRNTIWYGILESDKSSDGELSLQAPGLTNLLFHTRLESPVPPFGDTGDFDLSLDGVAFIARDPKKCPATYTKVNLYYMNLNGFTESKPPAAQLVTTGDLEGYSAKPVFSHNGKSLAFTRMKSVQYESDKPRLLLIPDIKDLADVQEFYETSDGVGSWDRRPDTIVWSSDDQELFVTAADIGRTKLFRLPSSPAQAKKLPTVIATDGSVGDVKLLGNDKLLLSQSSIVDASYYSVVSIAAESAQIISSVTKQGNRLGLSPNQVDEIWFKGAGDYQVHAWVVKPSTFDSSRRYPLALLIHGGPQGCWADEWSTRWNPAVWAEQGYVVVLPNPTGSTSYGMALQNGIRDNWGGRPYEDLVNCFEYVEQSLPFVDTTNAIAAGASYGGYMINWIQGHPLGRKFKALVCHDGVFSTLNMYSTEELFFPIHDFAGTIWENRAGYEKWDPARHLDQWATPQLVIHNELDYRLGVAEGLAMFNVLQSRGVPSRFLMFPDENHFVLKPENSLVWHREVFDWINKYSGVGTSGVEHAMENVNLSTP